MIYWNNIWSPICGHYFWDNKFGAKKFCEQLGCYSGGEVLPLFPIKGDSISTHPIHRNYSVDAFRLGMCLKEDKWGYCTGNCNDNVIGGTCFQNSHANEQCHYPKSTIHVIVFKLCNYAITVWQE